MFRKLIATDNDIATTILRLVLGVIFFAHAPRRCSDGSVDMASPAPWDSSPECCTFRPIRISGHRRGILRRIGSDLRTAHSRAAFGPFCNMIVAVAMIHHNFGFFMNWTGAQKAQGYEYHLLLLALRLF